MTDFFDKTRFSYKRVQDALEIMDKKYAGKPLPGVNGDPRVALYLVAEMMEMLSVRGEIKEHD